jgi:hypothetical protein
MKNATSLTQSILWAAAIIASATVNAPQILTFVLLPVLACASLLSATRASGQCAVK